MPHILQRQSAYHFEGGCGAGTVGGPQQQQRREDQRRSNLGRRTQIHYWLEPEPVSVLNHSEEKEEEEEAEGDQECAKQRTLNFDILTTTFDRDTNTIYQSKYIHHEIHINDLFECDSASHGVVGDGQNGEHVMVQYQIPRYFLQIGAGLKGMRSPQMMRVFKETMSETGRRLSRNHGLTALVMSFAGIMAFTAANDLVDFM